MGRHSQKSNGSARRTSLIALSVPAGLVAAASTAAATGSNPFITETSAHEAITPPVAPVHKVAKISVAPRQAAPEPPVIAPPAPAPAPAPAPIALLPTSLAASPIGIPEVAQKAYHNAEQLLAVQNPTCHMPWNLIAGIGRVESTHANDGKIDADGTLDPPIYGPILDGSLSGNNVVMDTDGGALDGNATYDRAVGPTQFLPETWKKFGADGNGDGKIDPQNMYDAALTTGKYLCDGGLDMRDLGQQTRAILRYNNSMAYVANVVAWSVAYATGVVPSESALPRI